MKTPLCLICLLLACQALQAGDLKASPSPAKPVATGTNAAAAKAGPVGSAKAGATPPAKTYVISKKTSFAVTAGDHNPFWPIGWVKMETHSSDNAASVIPRTEDFVVTSILLNDPPMAVINGKEMAEGELAAVPVNGQPVIVQLMAVQDGRVILRWQNQNIIVPLHRDETLSPTDTNPPVASR